MNDNDLRPRSRACPICAKPALPEFKPFCSKRCSDVDLNRWLVGSYAVPSQEEPEEEGGETGPRKAGDDA